MAEINTIVEKAARTEMTPIQEYIEKGILAEDAAEARMIKEKVHNYVMEDGVLYRNSYLGPLLRCIGSQQAKYVIKEIHMGSCEMYDGPRKAVHKAMNAGYYWPSMHRNANNETRICDSCQGMGIVRPLPETPGRAKYLIIAVDYFTKWLEAKPVTSITDNGTQLVNNPFKSWAEGLGIKLVSKSVYHPHANEAIERANRSIMQGIKTRLHQEGQHGWKNY
uniref:Integrase catalytic domain-containing protein n=1 Tax=Tanacetum cinerariifolium TaxID=118510 RepID=A0A6L2J4L4_TANCI|nr:hypothetical protein [Tanacetum cinerariifolium]